MTYWSTDSNNDVEMLFESSKLLLLNISTPSHLPAVLIVWVSKHTSTERKETERNTPKKNENEEHQEDAKG